MTRFLSIIFFLLFVVNIAGAQICEYSNKVVQDGEILTYQLYYQWGFIWVPAGEVSFSFAELEESYFVEVVGKTYESYNSIFEVDDYFSSTIDKETGRPETFIRNIREGSYTKFDSIHFDHQKGIATGKIGKNRELANSYSIEIGDCVHDLISILYAVRNTSLEPVESGKSYNYDVFFDNESFALSLEYMGVQEKKIKNLGKRSCHVLSPEVVAGKVFDKDSRMKIWVSRDTKQIPLLIESPVIVGSVKAILKESASIFP